MDDDENNDDEAFFDEVKDLVILMDIDNLGGVVTSKIPKEDVPPDATYLSVYPGTHRPIYETARRTRMRKVLDGQTIYETARRTRMRKVLDGQVKTMTPTINDDHLEEFIEALETNKDKDYWKKVRQQVMDKLILHMEAKYGLSSDLAIRTVEGYADDGNLYHVAKEELGEDYGLPD